MKTNNLLKNLLVSFSFLLITGCSQNVASGIWENTVKNTDGNSITTTLSITENQSEFIGAMTSQSTSNQADTNTKIDFSGYVSGNILVIEKLLNNSDPYFRKSTLTVSEDGKSLILSPSGLIFNKK